MANTIKIEGLRELDAALAQFKKSTARGVMNRALKRAAKPIADAAKQNAPVDTGALRDSIGISVARTGGAGRSAFADALRSGASRAEAAAAAHAANSAAGGQTTATVQVAAKAPHAVFAEYGTRERGGTLFLSAAMHSRRGEALKLLGKELGSEINKTAKRIAARQARKSK